MRTCASAIHAGYAYAVHQKSAIAHFKGSLLAAWLSFSFVDPVCSNLPDMLSAVSMSSTPCCSDLNNYSRSLPTCSTRVSSRMTSSWTEKTISID